MLRFYKESETCYWSATMSSVKPQLEHFENCDVIFFNSNGSDSSLTFADINPTLNDQSFAANRVALVIAAKAVDNSVKIHFKECTDEPVAITHKSYLNLVHTTQLYLGIMTKDGFVSDIKHFKSGLKVPNEEQNALYFQNLIERCLAKVKASQLSSLKVPQNSSLKSRIKGFKKDRSYLRKKVLLKEAFKRAGLFCISDQEAKTRELLGAPPAYSASPTSSIQLRAALAKRVVKRTHSAMPLGPVQPRAASGSLVFEQADRHNHTAQFNPMLANTNVSAEARAVAIEAGRAAARTARLALQTLQERVLSLSIDGPPPLEEISDLVS